MSPGKGGYGHADMHQSRAPSQQRKNKAKALRVALMSLAPAHCTRDAATTASRDLEAEVGQVILLPYAMARAPYVQHITDGRCATCHRSSTMALWGPPLLTTPHLWLCSSRLRRFRCFRRPSSSALARSCSTRLTCACTHLAHNTAPMARFTPNGPGWSPIVDQSWSLTHRRRAQLRARLRTVDYRP